MQRPKLLLFDANCIFEVMRLGLWAELCAQYTVVVPSTVIADEAIYFKPSDWKIEPIDLGAEVQNGTIEEYSATALELAAEKARLPAGLAARTHAGELEALCYLRKSSASERDLAFLTSDGPAIQAAVCLELGDYVRPLSEILDTSGMRRPLNRQFGPDFVAEHRQRGLAERLAAMTAPKKKGRRGR